MTIIEPNRAATDGPAPGETADHTTQVAVDLATQRLLDRATPGAVSRALQRALESRIDNRAPATAVPESEPASATASVSASASASASAVKDIAPLSVALVPFALAIGAAAAANGLGLFEAMVGAALLMAGTSQLATVELVGAGAGVVLTVITAIVINLRFVLYSTGMARWFDGAPLGQRLLLAFTLVDQNFLVCQNRFDGSTDLAWNKRYYVTASAMLVAPFLGFQLIGYWLGAGLPDQLGLHLAAPLAFAGMLAKSLQDTANTLGATVAAIVTLVAVGLPGGLGFPVAVTAGLIVGSMVGSRTGPTQGPQYHKENRA